MSVTSLPKNIQDNIVTAQEEVTQEQQQVRSSMGNGVTVSQLNESGVVEQSEMEQEQMSIKMPIAIPQEEESSSKKPSRRASRANSVVSKKSKGGWEVHQEFLHQVWVCTRFCYI